MTLGQNELIKEASGARLTKIIRCHNSQDIISCQIFNIFRKRHILQCMGSKFCAKFQRAPLKFHTKFWTHTLQYMLFIVFYFYVQVTISLNCDIISLSETALGMAACIGELGQHWMWLWCGDWEYRTITWTTIDSSSKRSSSIHLRKAAASLEMLKISDIAICL